MGWGTRLRAGKQLPMSHSCRAGLEFAVAGRCEQSNILGPIAPARGGNYMKKTTKTEAAKAAKSTTPATPAPSPVKKTRAPAKPKAAKTASNVPAVNDDVARSAPPQVKDAAAVPLSTTIVAQIDVGFGNTLYIRGEGPGLSWETGVALDCVADDKWSITLAETAKPIVFKFLINDQTWCAGDDYVAQPGTTITVTPTF
jgi:hypothetical protein